MNKSPRVVYRSHIEKLLYPIIEDFTANQYSKKELKTIIDRLDDKVIDRIFSMSPFERIIFIPEIATKALKMNNYVAILKELYDDTLIKHLDYSNNPFLKMTVKSDTFQGVSTPIPIINE